MALFPKQSGELIANQSRHVSILEEGIKKASDLAIEGFMEKKICMESYKSHPLHPKDITASSTLDWIFLIDSLNFSFWSETNDKYQVTYHNESYTGYWSLCAAINRAVEEGYNIISPTYYSSISFETLQHIFRSESGIEIPLLKERLKILQEIGKCLVQNFEGTFMKCVELCNKSAQKLLKLIVDYFPSYRDEAIFEDYRVSFYKRAQILIGDIWCCFEGKGYGAFDDINSISMFADYRVPQVLVYLGVLKYSDELKELLVKGELIENGHRYEVEIRGCTIWAVELMNKYMKMKQNQGLIPQDIMINAILVDNFLWDYRREHSTEMEHIPFHKTRCIFY